jgi:hypothetical protein
MSFMGHLVDATPVILALKLAAAFFKAHGAA